LQNIIRFKAYYILKESTELVGLSTDFNHWSRVLTHLNIVGLDRSVNFLCLLKNGRKVLSLLENLEELLSFT
jgi:hypothetical protein